MGGEGGEGGAVLPPECASNAECIDAHDGELHVCKHGRCERLLDDDCWAVLPVSKADEYVRQDGVAIIGGYTKPLVPVDMSPYAINWDFALDEFNTGTFDGQLIDSARPRPFVIVLCDPLAEDLGPGLEHLTKELEVRAVLASMPADTLYEMFKMTERLTQDDGEPPVFFMGTGNADMRLASLNDDGLVWHMLGDPRVMAETIASLVRRIEPTVNARRTEWFQANGGEDPAMVPLRVTLISGQSSSVDDIANVLVTTDEDRTARNLTFNGKSVVQNGTNFQWIQLPAADSGPLDWWGALEKIRENPPHVIVNLESFGVARQFIDILELYWSQPTWGHGLPPPHYVMSHFNYLNAALVNTVGIYTATTPPLSHRLIGVNYALAQDEHSRTLMDDYYVRLRTVNPDANNTYGTENYYDSAYAVFYALASALRFRSAPSGLDIRDALLGRVFATGQGVQSVDIGPTNVATVVTGNANYSLWGTMGPPNFERLSGTRFVQTSAWCIEFKTEEGVYGFRPDGLIYDSETATYREPTFNAKPGCMSAY
jgi:hypothetical protein